MNFYCFISPIGFGLLNLSEHQTINWSKFSGAPENIAETYWEIMNNHNYADIKKILPSEGIIHIDNRSLYEYLVEEQKESDVQIKFVPLTFETIKSIDKILTNEEQEQSDNISKLIASVTVQNQKETRDVYISQAIASLDDMTKTINLVSNRLREWYGLHFPELGEYIEDPAQLFRLVRVIGNKDASDWNELMVSDSKAERLKELGQGSLGAEINMEDLKPIQDLAKLGLELINTRREIEEYIDATVFVIMPNVTRLIGPLVSARLLAQAGSLRGLSKMASSTVQLLGAETALFRHLKTGEKPPKHGYLFQNPLIHQAPFHQRGRIARIIAGKITIAARLDYFLGEEQPGLVEDLNKRLEYVATNFAKAPVREKRPESRSRSDRDRGSKRGFDGKSRKKYDDQSKRGFNKRSSGSEGRRSGSSDSRRSGGSEGRRTGGFGGKRSSFGSKRTDDRNPRSDGNKKSEGKSDSRPKKDFGKRSDKKFGDKPKKFNSDSSRRRSNRGDNS